MFSELMESARGRERNRGGMLVSAVVHSFVILLAVRATGVGFPAPTPDEPREVAIPVLDQPVASAPPVERQEMTASPRRPIDPVPSIPLPAPVFIPTMPDVNPTLPLPDQRLGGIFDGSQGLVESTADSSGFGSGGSGSGGVLDNTQAEKPAIPMEGNMPPHYPYLLRRAGITGVVVVEFIIDTDGRVRPGSVVATRSDDPRFLEAVRAALPDHRFMPAASGGKPVPVRVRQVFTFELEDRR